MTKQEILDKTGFISWAAICRRYKDCSMTDIFLELKDAQVAKSIYIELRKK